MVTIVFSKLVIKDTDVFYRPVMTHSTEWLILGLG